MKIINRVNKFISRSVLSFAFSTLILTLTFTLTSCEEPTSSGGGDDNASVTLSVADVSCTEAWLRVTTEGVNLNEGAEFTLLRDDSVRSSFPIYSADTVIYDEGLLPSKTYRYTARLTFTPTQTNESVTKESNAAEAVTMDTTSHEFTWEIFTFGGGASYSVLYDVAIINENDIWAVGEIHTSWTDQYDSNGVWVQPYNAVHWNGQEWELRRVFINNIFYPIRNIMAFAENDIVFANISVIFWTGTDENITFTSPPRESTDAWRINSMWGISSEDFYVVGNGGNIAHYQNGTWTKVEYQGSVNMEGVILNKIKGEFNIRTQKYEIIISYFTNYTSGYYAVGYLTINEQDKAEDFSPGYDFPEPGGFVFKSGIKYFFGNPFGYLLYAVNEPTNWQPRYFSSSISLYAADGNVYNDAFFAGDGKILHYNGVTWRYCGPSNADYFGNRIAVKDDLVVLTADNRQVIHIYLGRR